MKILFALNQNIETYIEEKILLNYSNITGKEFDFSKEYDLNAVVNKLRFETFDLLILNEELERDNPVTTTFIDDITDKFPKIKIVLIIKSDHEKDVYVRKLFNIGVYDVLYSHDISIESIVELIIKPRSKAETKVYLNLHDIENVVVEDELNYISDEELYNILDYMDKMDLDKIEETFNHICIQYNNKQIMHLISFLPKPVIDILKDVENEYYKEYISMSSDVLAEDKQKGLKYYKDNLSDKETEQSVDSKFKLPKLNFPQRKTREENIVTKVEKEYINIVPDDYRKVVAILGERKVGTTTITSLVANFFSKEKKILVIDVAKNGLFLAKSWGNEEVVSKEEYKKLIINDNFMIIKPSHIDKVLDLIEKFKYDNDIILIDGDLNLPSNILRWVDMILHVATLDIMDVKDCKTYFRKAMLEGVNLSKVYLVLNKYVKCKVTLKDMMNLYKEPLAYLEDEHDGIPFNDVSITIPFEEEFYINSLSNYIYIDEKLKVTPGIDNAIYELAQIIYPVNKKERKGFLNQFKIKFL